MRYNLNRFRIDMGTDYSAYGVSEYPIRYKRKYRFDPSISVTPRYRRLISDIRDMDRLLGDVHLNKDDYVIAMKDSYASNIRTSPVKDGMKVDLSDMEDFIDAYHALDDRSVDVIGGPIQEIYNNMRAFAYGVRRDQCWDVDGLMSLHRILMDGVDERIIPGKLRAEKHALLDDNGSPLCVSCPSDYIRSELESLLVWLNGSSFDPISTGMMFVIEFSGIQPFEYGNNRVTHTMFEIILHDLGLKNIGLCRYDDLIDADRKTYNRLLDYARSEQDFYPVSLYVAERIHSSYLMALEELGAKDRLDGGDGYMVMIARCARDIDDEFTVAEACSWIPDVREQTVRTKLNGLVDLGILDRKGNTRNTRYRYNDFLKHMHGGYNMF